MPPRRFQPFLELQRSGPPSSEFSSFVDEDRLHAHAERGRPRGCGSIAAALVGSTPRHRSTRVSRLRAARDLVCGAAAVQGAQSYSVGRSRSMTRKIGTHRAVSGRPHAAFSSWPARQPGAKPEARLRTATGTGPTAWRNAASIDRGDNARRSSRLFGRGRSAIDVGNERPRPPRLAEFFVATRRPLVLQRSWCRTCRRRPRYASGR